MAKFEFEISLTAPTEKDAIQKMQHLHTIGSKLTLNELRMLANAVSNPVMLAAAKKHLGL